MSQVDSDLRPHWGSRFAFVAAAAGSAIGLGNIWKFPYLTGSHGGGAFVLIYLLTIAMVGIPIMAAEIMVGKTSQSSPIGAFDAILKRATAWRFLGIFATLGAVIILSYYSVVSGWTLHYCFLSMMGTFKQQSPEMVPLIFNQMYTSAGLNIFWHFVVMAIVTMTIYKGIRGGIERATKILMPVLFGILVILFVHSMMSPGALQGIRFIFYPDFSKITPLAILEAVGQGFFSLSLGMGAIMTYGSYLPKETGIAKITLAVVFSDTLIALLAGLVIFPIVFAYGFEPAAGPGLVFQTLPVIFAQMPGGTFFATLFFLLLFLAALTSAISLLEVLVATFVDAGWLRRHRGTLLGGFGIFILGIPSALSGGLLSDFHLPVLQRTFFDSFDYLATNWLLPLGGLFIASFVGWVMPADLRQQEFKRASPWWWPYKIWLLLLRFVAPTAVITVFLNKVGIL